MKKIFTLFLGVIIAVNVWAEDEETTTTITDNGNGIYSYVYDEDEGTLIGLQLVGVKNGATSLTIQTSITVDNTSYDVVSIASDTFSNKDNCWWVSKIYVSWETPIDVQLDDSYLDSFNSTPYLYVPTSSIDSYFNSNWANYFLVSFEQGDGYKYEVLTSDETSHTVSIIGHPSISGEYTLPSSVKVSEGTTYDVTETVSWAFQKNTTMTSLIIPTSYTTIGIGAFYSNTYLTTVKFEDNSNLTTIAERIFSNCTALKTVDFGKNSFETLGAYAFYMCTSLAEIEIPSSVTIIDARAFNDCTALEYVTFEDNSQLEKIDQYAFCGDDHLIRVAIPSNVTTIVQYAFQSCSALENVTFDEDSKLTTIEKNAFDGCTNLTSIEIPSAVTSIGQYAFNNATSLTNVTLPSTTTIGSNVFKNCSLASLTITGDEMTTTLSPNSFNVGTNSGCILYVNEGLERSYYEAGWGDYFTIYNYIEGTEIADVESGLTYVITDQYDKKVQIVSVLSSEKTLSLTIPESVTSEEYGDFTVTSIASDAFKDLESLILTVSTEIEFEITDESFAEGFTGVLICGEDLGATYIENGWDEYFAIVGGTFNNSGLTYQITAIGDNNSTVEIVGATESEIEIVQTVDYNGLTFTVTKIADSAFADQSDLTVTVRFEDPETIALGAFAGGNIGTLNVVDGTGWAFYTSKWAKYFTIVGTVSFTTDDGFEYTLTDNTGKDVTISAYSGNGGDITIEQTVTADNGETYTIVSIDYGVFTSANLSSVTVSWDNPGTVSPEGAFTEGDSVTLRVPVGLEVAYSDSDWGKYFTIEGYIEGTEIADEESGLTYVITDQYEKTVTITGFTCAESVTIPANITYNDVEYTITAVAENVFNCNVLKEVTMEATVPPFDAAAFENIADGAILIVPEGAKEAYSSWQDSFTEILDGTERSTALINIYSDKVEVVRYNLLGQKVNAPVRGINIVKYSDGTVEKVLVK